MKHITILLGGTSSEKDISLITGNAVYNALYQLSEVSVHKYFFNKDISSFIDYLKANKNTIVFNALHGPLGEDGRVQSILDLMNIPYTHSGVLTSSLCMNKSLTKNLLQSIEVPMVKHQEVNPKKFDVSKLVISFPLIIKPNNEGSSFDTYVVKDKKELSFYLNKTKNYSSLILEEYINGIDCTVSVLNGEPLAVTEIRPSNSFYDYNAKYSNKSTKYILPASFSYDIQEEMKRYAKNIYHIIKARGAVRVDFMYNKEKNKFYFLEVNTQPGMTETSLLPEQAKYLGISFTDLCYKLISLSAFDY